MILGQTVVGVFCMKGNLVHQYPVEDTAVVMLRLSEGTIATVDCLFNVPDVASPNRLEVYGSRGSLLAQGTIGQGCCGSMSLSREHTAQGYDARQIRASADRDGDLPLEPVNLYRAEIEEFGLAIETNQEPFASGQQGLRIQRILAACQLSAETKTSVVVDCAP
jgi:predicted dehydrogenase